jgi:hypothetical protein
MLINQLKINWVPTFDFLNRLILLLTVIIINYSPLFNQIFQDQIRINLVI